MARDSRQRRIALLGVFGVGNYGNEASLEAMLRQIRRLLPDTDVSCICADPARVAADFGLATVAMSSPTPAWLMGRTPLIRVCRILLRLPMAFMRWIDAVRYLRGTDEVIIPGTGILDDFGERPSQLPYALLRWCMAARLCGAELKLVSVGAGPIHHPLTRWLMKRAAAFASYRSYRDAQSKDFMTSIGFDATRDKVYPDLVFSLPTPTLGTQRSRDQRLSVGIGVMTYYGWMARTGIGERIYRTYMEKLTQFVMWLVERNYHVRLLVGQATDDRAVQDLLNGVTSVKRELSRADIVAEPIHSIHDLMREIDATDIVVATRFHNVVCALMLNKPVISCGYADKNDVLLAEMGLEAYCQRIEDLDVDRLRVQFEGAVQDREKIRGRLIEMNREYRETLAKQYAELFSPDQWTEAKRERAAEA